MQLESVPESVTLVRAGLKGIGILLDLDADLLDDLQMVASEACNNVVMHAYHGLPGPLAVRMTATHDTIEIAVRDRGEGLGERAPLEEHGGLGLVVIESLADRAHVSEVPGGGTEVTACFDREIPALSDPLEPVGPGQAADLTTLIDFSTFPDFATLDDLASPTRAAVPLELPGDFVGAVAPVSLLAGVLGRVTRALAAQARFSVERFSDVHLVVDSLVGHVQRFAADRGVCFALDTETRQLMLRVGPLAKRQGESEDSDGLESDAAVPLLRKLADRLEHERLNGTEMLCLTLSDAA